MSTTAHQPPLKMEATRAAAMAFGTAVALTEFPAAFVSFQRHQPGFPPTQHAISAPYFLTSARHVGGSIAIYAVIAVTTATFSTFGMT